MQRYNIKGNFNIESIVQKYAQWIREGKLKPSSEWNKDLGIKFTVHDPCQLVRKGFGNSVADDIRYTLAACVGEENIVEMYPNRDANYCCGGGAGALQAGFPEERRQYGKIKYEQILTTKADYVVAPCHNCHSQLHDIAEHFGAEYKTIHLWTILAFALNVLGDEERIYLDEPLVSLNPME